MCIYSGSASGLHGGFSSSTWQRGRCWMEMDGWAGWCKTDHCDGGCRCFGGDMLQWSTCLGLKTCVDRWVERWMWWKDGAAGGWMIGVGGTEDGGMSRPAWKTTVFFLHPDSSWRFRKSPLAVSFTWKLDSDSLGDHNIVSVCNPIFFTTWNFSTFSSSLKDTRISQNTNPLCLVVQIPRVICLAGLLFHLIQETIFLLE